MSGEGKEWLEQEGPTFFLASPLGQAEAEAEEAQAEEAQGPGLAS